ncbi:putative GABA permease [Aspergillus desertorum]
MEREKSHCQGEKGFSRFTILSMSVVLMATWEALSSTMVSALVMAVVGALATSASLAELSSMYPTAGGQYHSTAMLAPGALRNSLSWAIGWIDTFGWISFAASAPFFAATMLQSVIVLNHESYGMDRWQGTLIYWALVALGTAINIWGSLLLSIVENVSLIIHVCAFIAIFTVLWVSSPDKHSAGFVFTTFLNSSGWSSDGIAWSIGMLSSCYKWLVAHTAMIGSDLLNGGMGFVFLVAVLFCMGDMEAALNSPTGYPIIEIFRSATGSRAASSGMAMIVILTALLATIALIAAAARMVWSLAREGVNPKTQLPARAILATSSVLALLGVVNIGSTTALNAIISLAVLGLQASYLIPIALMLWRRLPPARGTLIYGPWRLGPLGVPFNIVSVLYLSYTTIFMVLPPYQPVTAENMNYSSLIFGTVLIFSAVYWIRKGRGQYTGPQIRFQN